MCNDFPRGFVNVNRINRSIITFPQAAEKTQACGYFLLARSESVKGHGGPHGRKGGPHPQLLADEKKNRENTPTECFMLNSLMGG